ncbi:MAG TPA: hypothetical protein VFW31_13000 [Candidatus Angelobacter sp.]|nr:hypothetical protein [Candidatus Angelobacter sp.]
MNFDREDEKLEVYLRQFSAQTPRPLPQGRKPLKVRIAALAAIAALILLAIGVIALREAQNSSRRVVLVTTRVEPQPAAAEVSMIRLSRFAQQDPDSLGAHLDSLSPRLLPDVRSGKGVLHHLARE